MKGKKAVQAQNRRDHKELIRQAEDAERRAARAERELAALREVHESKVADLIRQRDEVATPALKLAQSKVEELSTSLTENQAQTEAFKKAYKQLRAIILGFYWERGHSLPDIDVALDELALEAGAVALTPSPTRHDAKRHNQGHDQGPLIQMTAKRLGHMYSKGETGEIKSEMKRLIGRIMPFLKVVG